MMMCDDETMVKTLFRMPYLRRYDHNGNRYHNRDREQEIKLAQDWRAFQERFASEEACHDYLFHLKWPNGYICPRCGHSCAAVITTRRMPLYQCRLCRHQTTLTSGTMMEGSRTPLGKWLAAFFFLSRTEIGVNALQLQALLNVTYKTAWSICRKIREAISNADADQPLSGLFQEDGGDEAPPASIPSVIFERDPQERPILVGASLNASDQPGHVKIKLIPLEHMDGRRLQPSGIRLFEEQHVKEGTSLELSPGMPFRKKRKLQNVFDYSIGWLARTYGSLGPRYLQSYLDEICYYFNMKAGGRSIFDGLSQLGMNAGSNPAGRNRGTANAAAVYSVV